MIRLILYIKATIIYMFKLEDIQEISIINKKLPLIKFVVNHWCNFRCSYCSQKNSVDKANKMLTFQDLLDKTNRLIVELHKRNIKKIYLEIVGGEVSFYDIVDAVLKPLINNNINLRMVHLTSNFSGPNENFIKILNFCIEKNKKININLSYHDEFFDLDKFFQKLTSLLSANKNYSRLIKVSTVINEKTKIYANKIIEKSNKLHIKYSLNYDLDFAKTVDLKINEPLYKKFFLILKNNTRIKLDKDFLFKEIGYSKIPTDEKFLCMDRNLNLKWENNKLTCICNAMHQAENLNDIICNKPCSLCGNVHLKRISD